MAGVKSVASPALEQRDFFGVLLAVADEHGWRGFRCEAA
jgi:hypothetical protein